MFKFHAPAFFKELYNRKMLRTCPLALATFYAVGGLSLTYYSHNILALAAVPALVMILIVLDCKYLRDRNVLRAAIGAVMTSSAFD